jgi:uncharacterized membrane protein
MDQVGVQVGGCNPVPILPENREMDNVNITIPEEFLKKAKSIFENWKTEY